MVAGVWSTENVLQLEATTQFRKLLSIGIYMIRSLLRLSMSFSVCLIVVFEICVANKLKKKKKL